MDELAILPKYAGVDEDVLDRTVLTAHPRLAVTQMLPFPQPPEEVLDHFLVCVELGDGMADVLVRGVTEQVQFGLVGSQDDAIRPDPMQSHGGAVEEVSKLALALANLL